MSIETSSVLKIMALGRPFQLGMLYDFTNDKLIPSITLWKPEQVSNHMSCRSLPSASCEIHTEDTFIKRADLLGMDANLKISVLTDHVELFQSAKLINDRKTTEHQQRFIVKYSITTNLHQLKMINLSEKNEKHSEAVNQQNPTHVVTGILYGAEVYFIFSRTVFSDENQVDVNRSVMKLLEKMTTLRIFENDQLNLDDSEKIIADSLSCQYYGDFYLNPNPTTFKQAAKLFLELPKLLGKNEENTIPKQVWLYPLHLLDEFHSTRKIFYQISNDSLTKSVELIDRLQRLKMIVNDLKNSLPPTILLHQTEQQLSMICIRINEFESTMKEQMRKLLPQIRGGIKEEIVLVNLLKTIDLFAINKQKLHDWIQIKTEEIKLLVACFDDLGEQVNINISDFSFFENKNNVKCEFTLRLIIHVIENNDLFINEMFQFLNDDNNNKQSAQNSKIDCWNNQDNFALIQNKVTLFSEFAQRNNMKQNVRYIAEQQYIDDFEMRKDVSIILYHSGIATNFEIPSKPGQPHANNITNQNVTLSWTKPIYGSEYIQQYNIYGQNDSNPQWELLFTTTNNTSSTVLSNLIVGKYQLKVQGITIVGYTATSDVSDIIDIVDDISTEKFLSKQSLTPTEKNYYDECKEYYQLTKQPLISISHEVLDDKIDLQSSSIIFAIDEDVNQFDLADFLRNICNKLNLDMNDIVIKQIQSGSVILETEIYNKFESNDKKLRLKMIYHKLTDKAQKDIAKMKVFFMFMGPVESLCKMQKYRAEIKLNPKYNRIYARNHNYWQGALNDGKDRGNKPYYCPVGWQRWSFYVADNFYEKFKGWCICYHGTKFSYGLSILLSGLKPADRAEHGAGIYGTPSINYACHPRYSEIKRIESSLREKIFKSGEYIQFVLECRVHPSNIKRIRQETLDANTIIDSNINNNDIEWVIDHKNKALVDFNDPESSIICTGILTRVTDNHPGLLPQSKWWYRSHLCNNSNCCLLGVNLQDLQRQNQNGDKCNIIFN